MSTNETDGAPVRNYLTRYAEAEDIVVDDLHHGKKEVNLSLLFVKLWAAAPDTE